MGYRVVIANGQRVTRPYRIVELYGAFVVMRLTVNEDASPKLIAAVVAGPPLKTAQQAEALIDKIVSDEAAARVAKKSERDAQRRAHAKMRPEKWV